MIRLFKYLFCWTITLTDLDEQSKDQWMIMNEWDEPDIPFYRLFE